MHSACYMVLLLKNIDCMTSKINECSTVMMWYSVKVNQDSRKRKQMKQIIQLQLSYLMMFDVLVPTEPEVKSRIMNLMKKS